MRLFIFLQFVVMTFLGGVSSQAATVVPLVEAARAGDEKELRLLLSKAARPVAEKSSSSL